jgi:hypothetical protein
MVQLSATRCSCTTILWVNLVSFAAITLRVASQRVFIVIVVYSVIDSARKRLDTPSYSEHIIDCKTTTKLRSPMIRYNHRYMCLNIAVIRYFQLTPYVMVLKACMYCVGMHTYIHTYIHTSFFIFTECVISKFAYVRIAFPYFSFIYQNPYFLLFFV